MVKTILTGGLLLWLAGSFGLLGATTSSEREMLFRVMLDDRDIGLHSFRVSGDNGVEVIDSNAEFDISFFAIPFYSYEHDNRETWKNGCLDSIASTTDDNGDEFRVEGRNQGASFELATQDGPVELETGCVMTFAYWNRDILTQPRLLNAQNGEYLPVEVAREGADQIRLGESTVAGDRYRLRNEERGIDITVWYEQDSGHWLSLESRVEGGRVIRYLPVSNADRHEQALPAANSVQPGADSDNGR